MRAILFAALIACAWADTEFDKSVKGGHSNYQYKGGDVTRFYNFNNTQQGQFGANNQNTAVDFEVGVCYVEVPTASLVRDPSHVPTGNGSRSDLSRIRTCCKGYKRNVYNFRKCDPACTAECINGLCTAPDTCTCYPDHVRNLAGFCVATCPIGCQNGHCSGGECLCKEGYKLDRDSKFCVPNCGVDCDRIGNCTAPNTCSCKPGATHPICHGQTSPGSNQPLYPNLNNPQQTTNRPTQDPYYVLPIHNPDPINLNSYNQKRNDTIPNQNPYQTPNSYPQRPNTPNPQGTNSPNQGLLPHQPNQEPIPEQFGQNPHYPTYPINQNYPLYPGYQPTPNPTNPSSGNQQPHGPTSQGNFNQYPQGPNQGPYNPQYPYYIHTINATIPEPYPAYPANQVGPNPNQTPNQGGSSPHHPSGNQGPYTNNPYSQGVYPYPSNTNQPQQGGSYPQSRPGYSLSNSTYAHGQSYPHPPYQNNPYGQQPHGVDQNTYDQRQDVSSCPEPCVNGVCIENNQCRCNPGYIRDEDDITRRRCLPHCPGGCPNGYCAFPYSCECNEGYSKDTSVKGRAPCIKRIRRSADVETPLPLNVAELLVFEIPDYNEQ